jgi:hypothetical protein
MSIRISGRTGLTNKIAAAAAMGVFLYLAWLIFYRLSSLPGLHADEARFGLASINVMEYGIKTIHGVNSRTGALYPWIISLAFRLKGVNIFALRSVGAIANLAALALLTWSLHRYRGNRAVVLLLLIVLASPFFPINARVAWEVSALQFLLISIQISILLHVVYHSKMTIQMGLAFAIVSALGVFNHFIFLSNLIAFFLCSLSVYLLHQHGSQQRIFASSFVHLSFLTIVFGAILIVVKPIIGDSEKVFLVAMIFLFAFILCFYSFIRHSSEAFCAAFIDKPSQLLLAAATKVVLPSRRLPRGLRLGLAATIGTGVVVGLLSALGKETPWYFYVKHFWGLLGSLTSVLPLQRIMTHRIGGSYLLLSHSFWIMMMGIYLVITVRIVQLLITRKNLRGGIDLIFILYPVFAFLVLPVLVKTNSERYYLIACYLVIACLPVLFDSQSRYALLPSQQAKWPIHFVVIGMMLLISLGYFISAARTIQAVVFSDSRQDLQAFTVKYPEYLDSSFHFANTSKLYDYLKMQQVCTNNVRANFFILEPLRFYSAIDSNRCSGNRSAKIDYCETCSDPVKNFAVMLKDDG